MREKKEEKENLCFACSNDFIKSFNIKGIEKTHFQKILYFLKNYTRKSKRMRRKSLRFENLGYKKLMWADQKGV